MRAFRRSLAAAALAAAFHAGAATPAAAQQQQQKVLRIAMTAADVPTTSGMPNNGYEGMRFLGYPVFEPLVGWDLSRTDVLAGLKPALAESWEQDAADPRKWRFTAAAGRALPRRHAADRRRGGLELRPLLPERQPAIRSRGQRHHPRPHPGARRLPQARRPHGGAGDDAAGQLLALPRHAACSSPRRNPSSRRGATGRASPPCRPRAPAPSA